MTKDGACRLTVVTLAQMTAAHEATEDHVLEGLHAAEDPGISASEAL